MYFDNNIHDDLKKIERLLYGFNYQVCLRLDIFHGKTIIDFEQRLKNKYPEAKPHLCKLLPVDKKKLLSEITSSLAYRGDTGSGVILTTEKETELLKLQSKFFKYLNQFLNKGTQCFYYSDTVGIPCYPIFWGYRFVILTNNDKILFV